MTTPAPLSKPVLHVRAPKGEVGGVALVLHGGRVNGTGRVPPWAVAYLRMRPFGNALWREGAASGVAVAMLRHAMRGWNGELRSPVADARWALDQLRARFGDVDVALVGHSMGGRTALAAADDASVRTVVALAPWIEPGDAVEPVAGRNLLIAHGTSDHMTSPRASAAYAESARGIAKQVSYLTVQGERHGLLHRARFWHQLTAGYTTEMLVNRLPDETVDPETAKVIAAAVAGTPTIRV